LYRATTSEAKLAELRISKTVAQLVAEKLKNAHLTWDAFHAWLDEVEFLLSDKPREVLEYIGGSQPFRQLKLTQEFEGRKFLTIWEIDWDRDNNLFALFEFSPIEQGPFLARNSVSQQE
jgi:hypothetical protein